MTDNAVDDFRERAGAEARRYGTDPWVLVRELLQNARDAGARAVRIGASSADGVERLSFRDDGAGMGLAEARRYLLTLYASSKEDGRDQAGRFGVGFWSVLRFEPELITVRSWPRRGPAWELRLDGRLERVEQHGLAAGEPGLEVVLERGARGEDLAQRVLEAARRDAPYLRCRGRRGGPLEVTVNGRRATAALELPPPSLAFRRTGLRGAVALAAEPRVELYAYGLRVRSAASLDDLLAHGRERAAAGGPAALARGLAPQCILDSDRLEVLLARGEARESRELRRLVAVARRELERLVRRQLDRWAPRPLPLRLLEGLPTAWARPRARWAAVTLALTVASGLGGGYLLRRAGVGPVAKVGTGPQAVTPYTDLAAGYRGPAVEALGAVPAVDLSYRPPSRPFLLAALLLDGLTADGAPLASAGEPLTVYPAAPCSGGCVEVELGFASSAGALRLPVPSGYRVDPASVLADGRPVRVAASPAGEAVALFPGPGRGRLRYRAGPGPAWPAREGRWPQLPPPLAAVAADLRRLPVGERVQVATALVRGLVAYDASPATVARYLQVGRLGLGFLHRALVVGAGDCDVQNAVLAAVLAEVGLPSRLAVGFVAENGRAAPGLHAWVEVVAGGQVLVADASVGGGGAPHVPVVGPATLTASRRPAPAGDLRPRRGAASGRGMLTPAAVLLLALLAAVAAVAWVYRRGGVSLHLADDPDLSGLLRGALERPEAFARVGALQARRLVPLVGGGRVSLARARRLAGRALFRGCDGDGLAARAARRGVVVVDCGRPEGRVVADGLGAVDLDHWQALLDGSVAWAAAEPVESALARYGVAVRVRLGGGLGAPLGSLEVARLGLRVVLVDSEGSLCRQVEAAGPSQPALAALLLADAVARHLELSPALRGRVLGAFARAALAEEGRR